MMRRALAVALLAVALGGIARAQSTTRLKRRVASVELSVGTELDGYTSIRRPGELVAGIVDVRVQPGDFVGVLGSAWWLHARSDHHGATIDDVVAFVGEIDAPIRIGNEVVIAPSTGLGYVPYAHSRSTFILPDGTRLSDSDRNTGIIWTGGLALRWRHLVLEQHVGVDFQDGGAPFTGRDFYPITLGWRL